MCDNAWMRMLSLLFTFPDFSSYNPESFSSIIFKRDLMITAELLAGVYDSYSCCIDFIMEMMGPNSLSDKSIPELKEFRSICEVYENTFNKRIKLNSST